MNSFLVEKFPFGHTLNSSVLYNQEKYLLLYEPEKIIRFSWIVEGEAVISAHFHEESSDLLNAKYSSFGGIEHTAVGKEFIGDYLNHLVSWTSENNCKSIVLKLSPPFYNSHDSNVNKSLVQSGFKISFEDVNQYIKVSQLPYKGLIKHNERKRLRKCVENGFEFKELSSDQLNLAYDLIKDTRVRRNFPVSMTFEKLKEMFEVLPQHYFLFGVYDKDTLIAAAVSIRVTDSILYNFYHGDRIAYRSYSPIVMLLEGIYKFCQVKGFSYLDLGTSSVEGELNEGLFNFKKNCGAKSVHKSVFDWVKN